MTVSYFRSSLRVSLCVAGLAITSSAYGATTTTLDLTAGVGASSNPSLAIGGKGSAFGRLSALGMHEWKSERTTTVLSAYGENTTYLSGGYGSKQIFDLRASSTHAVNPNLTIFGNIGFQGDVDGQLSNRFTSVTPVLNPPPSDQPAPVVIDDPTFLSFDGRQYRLSGQVGLSTRANERGTISLSAGAQRNFSSGSQSNNVNFNSYFATAAYDHQFSERTTAGFSTNVQIQDYDHGLSSFVVNPLVTVSRQFSDQLSGTAAVGVLFSRQELLDGGTDSSINPSFSFSLCRAGERDRLCGRVSRDARSSRAGFGPQANALAISTLGSVNYFRKLDANQSFQASVSAIRSSSQFSDGDEFHTTYLSFLAGYDRKIRERLAVGITAGARKLYQAGRDPKADINANAFVRYRLGDLR